jgi:hypothetical protein
MAIVNRDLDPSQQKHVFDWVGTTQINTGFTSWIAVIPFPCVVQSMASVSVGVSAAMQVALQAQRFAAGNTVIGLGISNMILTSFGTSGAVGYPIGYSGLAAAGSTLLQLQTGDILMFQTSVANSAASQLALSVTVKKTQDIVQNLGVAT